MNQPVAGGGAPVAGEQSPSDDFELKFAGGGGQPGVTPAERRAKKFWRGVERGGDCVVATTKLVARLGGRRPAKIGMRVGGIADAVGRECGLRESGGIV